MINLALIGLGQWGKNYINTISSLKNCKLKYICSSSKITLNKFSDDFIKTTKYKSLLKHKDIDGIIVATPPKTHYEISKIFLKKGFNILIEKPFSLNIYQARNLTEISKRKIMVGHIYLYNPIYKKMKKSLKKVGEIKEINFQGLLSAPRKDVSVIWDWGPHPASIIIDLLDDYPNKIEIKKKHVNKIGLIDTIKIQFYIKRIKIKIYISWLGKRKKRKLIIKGTKGNLIFDNVRKPQKKLIFISQNGKKEDLRYRNTLALTEELKEFTEFISKQKKIISNGEFSTKVIQLLSEVEALSAIK